MIGYSSILTTLLLTVLFMGCQQGPSLQSYFVQHQESPGFIQADIPMSALLSNELNLAPDIKEAWSSVRRLNMLAFKKNDDEISDQEYLAVQSILKNEKYEELLRMNSKAIKTSFFTVGNDTEIEEIVFTISQGEVGFLVARLLGDNMTFKKAAVIANSLDQMKFNESALEQFSPFFK